MPRTTAIVAVVATVFGRAVAPALPGTAAGIAGLINGSQMAVAILSLYLFFFTGMLTVWLAVSSLAEANLPASYRLGVVPATALVAVLGIAALVAQVEPRWLLWMGVVSGSVALMAAPRALALRATRATGFVLALVGVGGLLHIVARMAAVRASEAALTTLYAYSRLASSGAFALHLAALVVAALWVARRRWVPAAAITVGVLVLALVLVAAARSGSDVDASPVAVLASRAFSELTRHPIPFVPALIRNLVHVLTFALAGIIAVTRHRSSCLASAVALALLGSGNTDIPLCAMMLTLAALLAPAATVQATGREDRARGEHEVAADLAAPTETDG